MGSASRPGYMYVVYVDGICMPMGLQGKRTIFIAYLLLLVSFLSTFSLLESLSLSGGVGHCA